MLTANGGVVMVNYAPGYVSQALFEWNAQLAAARAQFSEAPAAQTGLYLGQPQRAATAMADWEKAHPKPVVTLAQVADHVEHLAKVAGHDHVGLGADLDGIDETPVGLEGVETYPALLAELMRRGWSDADLAKLAGENVLRALARAEAVAASLRDTPPTTATIATLDTAK